MEYSRNPHAPTVGLVVRDFGLLILRLTVGAVVGFFHAWQEGILGWGYLWKKTPWPFLETLQGWGLPLPVVLATAATVIFGLCSMGLFFGAVSRVCALLLLICSVVGLLFSLTQPVAEKLYLYTAIYVVIFLCGPGCFSLDHLLNQKRK